MFRLKTLKLVLPSIIIAVALGEHGESTEMGWLTFGICLFLAILMCED